MTAVSLASFGLAGSALASVSLSVNPIDGSNALRFERTYTPQQGNKEIHLRVNSTGERFQVFQRILEPIINEKGESLNLQAVTTQTLPNSNSSGTLYLQNVGNLGMSDQLLYSSNPQGQNDAFVIGYTLNPALINASGTFRGRLVFTVRGQASSDQAIIDIFLETTASLKISVKGSHELNKIHVHASDTSGENADYLTIAYSGNNGQDIKVYQEVNTIPQNEEAQELNPQVLQVEPDGTTEGLRLHGANALSPTRTLVYSGNKQEDNFLIYFLASADQVQLQDAGTYRGKITYTVETPQGTQEFPVDLQFDVPPVFTMNVTLPPGGVKFSHVLANSPPQQEEVLVTVNSNLHKPYQVVQDLETNMTNSQGKEFDSKYLSLQVQIPPGQKGQSDFLELSSMKTGEYPVFSSDAKGSGATFKVLYRLQGYAQMNPGDFLAPVRFSLNQK